LDWIIYWILLSAWLMTKGGVKMKDWANCYLVEESLDFFWLKLNNLKKLLKLNRNDFAMNYEPWNL
jgi:hypothetical protein